MIPELAGSRKKAAESSMPARKFFYARHLQGKIKNYDVK